MSFGLSGSREKSRQEQSTTQTYTPNQGFLDRVNPGLDSAMGLMGNYRQTSQADIDRFANPYLSQVGDATSAALMRSRDVTGNNLDAQAAKAGAFGGTGWGLLRGENNRAYADAEASALAGINANGYQNALGAAMGENANSNQFDMGALQTYLSGLGLLGNWGTTTGNALTKGTGSQIGATASFKYGG
jgi:hypothetical protein